MLTLYQEDGSASSMASAQLDMVSGGGIQGSSHVHIHIVTHRTYTDAHTHIY